MVGRVDGWILLVVYFMSPNIQSHIFWYFNIPTCYSEIGLAWLFHM